MLLKNLIKFHEDVANDKDENDVEYLIDRNADLKRLIKSFLSKIILTEHQKNQQLVTPLLLKLQSG